MDLVNEQAEWNRRTRGSAGRNAPGADRCPRHHQQRDSAVAPQDGLGPGRRQKPL